MKNKCLSAVILYLLAFNFSATAIAETVELAYFKQKSGVGEQQLLKAAEAMERTIQHWDGFKSREMVYLGDDEWVDIVHWDDQSAANKAAEQAMSSGVCLSFFALIESGEDDMRHGRVMLRQ